MNRAIKWLREEIGCAYSVTTGGSITVPEVDLIRLLEERDRIRAAAGDEDAVALIQAAKKLPRTRDGARVVPGANVFLMDPERNIHEMYHWQFNYSQSGKHEWLVCGCNDAIGETLEDVPVGECYSTREAAEQAREGGQ